MKQNRQSKLVGMLALCVSVVGLTLGFAAFSNTLTISSSATVSPDPADFKLTVYGIDQVINNENYEEVVQNVASYDSKQASFPYVETGLTASNAKISNDTLTISDISINFIQPGYEAIYFFSVANESKYDAYFKIEDYENISHSVPTCTPGNGTTASLVSAACGDVTRTIQIFTPDGTQLEDTALTGSYKIERDSHVYMAVIVGYYGDNRADGDFNVAWDDITLDFSTAA